MIMIQTFVTCIHTYTKKINITEQNCHGQHHIVAAIVAVTQIDVAFIAITHIVSTIIYIIVVFTHIVAAMVALTNI